VFKDKEMYRINEAFENDLNVIDCIVSNETKKTTTKQSLDSQIMMLMKQNKSFLYHELVIRFGKDIKRTVEALIQKDYLERDINNFNLILYKV